MMPATKAQERDGRPDPVQDAALHGRNILIFSDGTGQAIDRYQESRRSV
jgi:hypothetical protein